MPSLQKEPQDAQALSYFHPAGGVPLSILSSPTPALPRRSPGPIARSTPGPPDPFLAPNLPAAVAPTPAARRRLRGGGGGEERNSGSRARASASTTPPPCRTDSPDPPDAQPAVAVAGKEAEADYRSADGCAAATAPEVRGCLLYITHLLSARRASRLARFAFIDRSRRLTETKPICAGK